MHINRLDCYTKMLSPFHHISSFCSEHNRWDKFRCLCRTSNERHLKCQAYLFCSAARRIESNLTYSCLSVHDQLMTSHWYSTFASNIRCVTVAMQQATASPRTITITIDDIISVFRISTQHQYNARELDTPVCLIVYSRLLNVDITLECNDWVECYQSVWSRLRLSGITWLTLFFSERVVPFSPSS